MKTKPKNQSELNYWEHLINYQKIYLVLLVILILGIPALTNYLQGEPLIRGGESYGHLSLAREISWNNFYYFPLKLVAETLPEEGLIFIQVILAVLSILLFLRLAPRLGLEQKFTFCFLALLIISPTFIFAFTTLSAYSIYLFLVLSGFNLLVSRKKKFNSFSVIPLILATFMDFFSSLLLIILLLIYLFFIVNKIDNHLFTIKKPFTFFNFKDNKKKITVINLGAVGILSIINLLLLKVPFILGPFHLQKILPDLISDLGGLSGINLFTLLLASIGLMLLWKRKNSYLFYAWLILTLIPYWFNTHTIFYLSIILTFFAAQGLLKLFQKQWNLTELKKYTGLVVILGLLFSTATYLERINDKGPSTEMVKALYWIKTNIPDQKIVFSDPQNSDYILYFSGKQSFYAFAENDLNKKELSQRIFSSLYIDELFPLLEQNQISIIYITKEMRSGLSAEQGLLFLLKNERFKIVYSSEDAEVWVFS